MRVRHTFLGGILVIIASMFGCLSITGLDQDFTETGAATGGGAPASSSGDGTSACGPLTEVPCYDGPAGTEGVGTCAGGTKTCNALGTAYGECVGQALPKNEDCAAPDEDRDCDGSRPLCPWSHVFGGSAEQYGSGVAVDQSGNVFITGSSEGEVDFGEGPLSSGIFLAKLDPSGELLWAYSFGAGATRLRAGSVSVNASGDCVLTGGYEGQINFGEGPLPVGGNLDAFLAVFDGESGDCTFSDGFGDGEEQYGTDAVLGDDGQMTLVGRFKGKIDLGSGEQTASDNYDMFMAKLDPDGNHVWSRRFGDGPDLHPHNIAFAGSDVVVVGMRRGAVNDVDFGFPCDEMTGADDTHGDLFVAKFDNANGDCRWSHLYGEEGVQDGFGLAVAGNGDVVVAGQFEGTVNFGIGDLVSDHLMGSNLRDIFVLKLDSAGQHVWSKAFPGAGDQRAVSAALDIDGAIVVAGYFSDSFNFNPAIPLVNLGEYDIFVAKFDASGNPGWGERFGDGKSQEAYGLALDPSGDMLITGRFEGSVELDKTLISAGGGDIFLAKLSR